MSCQIYIIEDINGLKYVGSTIQTLHKRLIAHKTDKKRKKVASSKLDLDNCEIKLLEICPIERRNEMEQYWIDRIECVNTYNAFHDRKKYRDENKEKILSQVSQNNKKFAQYKKDIRKYQKSWGGDLRADNNNLLKIDITLFQ